jgi:hypothetical protein
LNCSSAARPTAHRINVSAIYRPVHVGGMCSRKLAMSLHQPWL